jgi:predicted  nucleic acid-binding Zn-ribbon protein
MGSLQRRKKRVAAVTRTLNTDPAVVILALEDKVRATEAELRQALATIRDLRRRPTKKSRERTAKTIQERFDELGNERDAARRTADDLAQRLDRFKTERNAGVEELRTIHKGELAKRDQIIQDWRALSDGKQQVCDEMRDSLNALRAAAEADLRAINVSRDRNQQLLRLVQHLSRELARQLEGT